MGKIQVGQKSPKTIDMGGFTVLPNDVSGGAPAKPQPTENKESRAKRLAEIKVMDEAEQLPLLLEEGFNEEAKELSEKLAGLNGETADNADTNDEGHGEGDSDQGDDADNQVQQETSETPSAETSGDGETAKKENKEKSAPKRGGRKSSK